MKLRRIITCPGDLSLKFLIWRDTCNTVNYILTLPIAVIAVGVLLLADYVSDKYKV